MNGDFVFGIGDEEPIPFKVNRRRLYGSEGVKGIAMGAMSFFVSNIILCHFAQIIGCIFHLKVKFSLREVNGFSVIFSSNKLSVIKKWEKLHIF